MKKGFLFLAVAGLFMVTSCKKERTCECTSKMGGEDLGVTETVVEGKKCDELNTESTIMGITTSYTCVEK
ncbi:MAG: hypothetical protein ACOCWG_05200 [bacterium]